MGDMYSAEFFEPCIGKDDDAGETKEGFARLFNEPTGTEDAADGVFWPISCVRTKTGCWKKKLDGLDGDAYDGDDHGFVLGG